MILFLFVFGKWVVVVHRGIRLVTYLLVEGVLASGSRILRIIVVRIYNEIDDGNIIVEGYLVKSYLMYQY